MWEEVGLEDVAVVHDTHVRRLIDEENRMWRRLSEEGEGVVHAERDTSGLPAYSRMYNRFTGFSPLRSDWHSHVILNAWRPGERKVERSRTEYGPPIIVHKFDQGLVSWMHRFPGLVESDMIRESGLWHWAAQRQNGEPHDKCVRMLLGEIDEKYRSTVKE